MSKIICGSCHSEIVEISPEVEIDDRGPMIAMAIMIAAFSGAVVAALVTALVMNNLHQCAM